MSPKNSDTRVCVIGAGLCGMSVLYNFAKLGADSPEVVCYEKCSNWGGQWNYTWRTGTDEYGERVTSGVYRDMWTNLPKESIELAHYTFDRHFGNTIPSYFPASVMFNYLEGYWKSSKTDLSQMIKFNRSVISVTFDSDSDTFTVVTRHVIERKTYTNTFSHVIVATGIFGVPYVPGYKGFDTFPGRILHSQHFKGGKVFRAKRILVIGSSQSAEDVTLQCYKNGVGHVIISWKTKPMGYKFPSNVEERPQLTEVDGNVAKFKDGSTAEIDVIILCTGYKYDYAFLEDSLRIVEQFPVVFIEDLYKGMVWLKGGNQKLLYLGVGFHVTSLPHADAQAAWIVQYITERSPISLAETNNIRVTAKEIQECMDKIREASLKITDLFSLFEARKQFIREIAEDTGYIIDVERMTDHVAQCLKDRVEHLLEFRDYQFTSAYTGTKAEPPTTKWLYQF